VSISQDGRMVVVGSPKTSENAGSVQAFRYSNNDLWYKVGGDIMAGEAGSKVGTSVAVASDTIVLGGSNLVQVYKLVETVALEPQVVATSSGSCIKVGKKCTNDSACCKGSACTKGKCRESCVADKDKCKKNAECYSKACENGKCARIKDRSRPTRRKGTKKRRRMYFYNTVDK
jgi:hypothetical protein